MGCLGNILWFIFAGFWQGMSWMIVGVLWCLTFIGMPIGIQCFEIAKLCFFPFGKEVVYTGRKRSAVANFFWIIFAGWLLALEAVINGALLCLTFVGIPFGMQCFKIAKIALMPFGAAVVYKR